MGKKKSEKKKEVAVLPPVPGFFGHVLKPGHKLQWKNDSTGFCMQLNSAALGADAIKGRSTLSVTSKMSKIALCSLTPEVAEQWNLTQTFTVADGAVEFVVGGSNAIHLTGFIEEEGSGDENDYNESDGEEDEMMMFGGDEDDSSVDVEDNSEVEMIDESKKSRFEVLEERLHNEPVTEKVEMEAKKQSNINSNIASKKKIAVEVKKEVKKEVADKKVVAAGIARNGEQSKEDKKIAKQKIKEKEIVEKIAEVTGSHPKNKKRAAAVESVEVPKKAKVATRVHKGVTIEEIAVGKGGPVQRGRKVSILYRGRLTNGKQFDSNQSRKKPFTFRHGIGDVIKGMDIGIEGMRVGSKRTIKIPAKLGYGREGMPPTIPGNADLIFDIELVNA
ncbi:fkbp-type peptidylprolyl cis-trans isomerase [Plasmopara halstedii]|uniref:FK506-binding protein n=1 Tax=Plasmopara halstedii TaxID=4781 RepID=A0A0P1AVM3_PLAHL|nr:fkbp-type peptidylprolyl cis-trans isomerase [Plasmopara halstedii]CEG45101.1 fkbp-type peptidylprolyl cis-trans isomerase [Plasmopara halstedii]|eukprot:XP_024581470.1 fkbp-type peptidylprolyl cis-trans isomerase [Plasmopara halstedii]